MIYFMDGKTYLNDFIPSSKERAKKAQYVIVSSTLRKTGKYESQVINMNNALFPSNELIMDYSDYKHNDEYAKKYMEFIKESKPFFATVLRYVLDETKKDPVDVIFLCGKKERRFHYLKLIQKFVEDEFGYHIIDYRKFVKNKDKYKFPKQWKKKAIKEECKKILKDAKNEKESKLLQSESGRDKLLKTKNKKELKKELKERDLYIDGMSKSDMIDMLKTIM